MSLLLLAGLAASLRASDASIATATRLDGSRVMGRVVPAGGSFQFEPNGAMAALDWPQLAAIDFPIGPDAPDRTSAPSPFRILLGGKNALSGTLVGIDRNLLRFRPASADSAAEPIAIARGGLVAVLQRLGQARVLVETFETLDPGRWRVEGQVETVDETGAPADMAVRLRAGGAGLSHELAEPISSGRIELAFRHDQIEATGHKALVEFVFAGLNGPETIGAEVGWGEDYPKAISRGGPSLVVQPLIVTPGWHRLAIRFRGDRTLLSIDGDELAAGAGPGGPLVGIRIRTATIGKAAGPNDLAFRVDDLAIIRLFEPSGSNETDPTQDEVRLVEGDQVWGRLSSADAEGPTLDVEGRAIPFSWSEVAGLYLRRAAMQSSTISGTLARVEWAADAHQDEPDRLEGAIASWTADRLELDSPFVGRIAIPTTRLRRVTPMGTGSLLVLDAHSHHLGDQAVPELDPVLPEADRLDLDFKLDQVPSTPLALRMDVLDVEGDYEGGRSAEAIRKGELVTEVILNGHLLGTLNSQIRTTNKIPETIELEIPAGLIKQQENRLSIVQKGRADEPTFRDDLGILGIALRWR